MTMPIAPGTRVVELPPPRFPMLMMMFTDALVPGPSPATVSQWVVTQAHPYDSTVKVLRMYADEEGVEVYSSSNDGMTCIRDFVPMRYVRLARESMPIEVFVQELENAESDEDLEPEPEIAPPNDQTLS